MHIAPTPLWHAVAIHGRAGTGSEGAVVDGPEPRRGQRWSDHAAADGARAP